MVGKWGMTKDCKWLRHSSIFCNNTPDWVGFKHLVRKQNVAPALYFQGETGLRGEVGTTGRDGARVSKMVSVCLHLGSLSFTCHSIWVEKLSKIELTKEGFKFHKRVFHSFLDRCPIISLYLFQKKTSTGFPRWKSSLDLLLSLVLTIPSTNYKLRTLGLMEL